MQRRIGQHRHHSWLHLEEPPRRKEDVLFPILELQPHRPGLDPGQERRMPGQDPKLPKVPVAITIVTGPEKISFSALTMSQCMVVAMA